jgi:hypothetical protein
MKLFCLIFLSVLFLGCKTDLESIQGHWHNITYSKTNTYRTLDIEDSVVYMNKTDRSGFYSSSPILINGKDLLIKMGPYGAYYLRSEIHLKSDTLTLIEIRDTLEENAMVSYWIRANNDINDIAEDFSSNLLVNIDLSVDNKSIPFDSVGSKNKWCILNIGYPKFKSTKYPNDSLIMNLNDAIANFSDLPMFLEAENENIWIDPDFPENDSLAVIINADSSTPKYYFDSIYYFLKQYHLVSTTHRTYVNEDFRGIGLRKLQ